MPVAGLDNTFLDANVTIEIPPCCTQRLSWVLASKLIILKMHYRGKLLSLTKKVVPEVNAFCHSDVPLQQYPLWLT